MGADIYLNSVYKENSRKQRKNFIRWCNKRDKAVDNARKLFCQSKVNLYHNKMYEVGYFRDSYNMTSLMLRLGVSWWRDITPRLDRECRMPIEDMRWLRSIVATAPLRPLTEEDLKGSSDPASVWMNYFEDKRKDFLKLLDLAIAKGESLYCSC